MILAKMKFGDFEWPRNPLSIKVTNEYSHTGAVVYGKGKKIGDAIREFVVYSGKGEFAGADCLEQYKRLQREFDLGKEQLLTLPGAHPVFACFSSLQVEGEVTPDLLTYSFKFVREANEENEAKSSEYTTCDGETLFDIAHKTGVSVQKLVELNPQIKRPDEIANGERVRLC